MRIVHVISGIDARSGGTVAVLAGLTSALSAAGLQVQVVSSYRRNEDLSLADKLRSQGVDVQTIGPCIGPLSWHPRMRLAITEAFTGADIVHIHAVWEQVQHQAARIAYQKGVPYVITPHGMFDPWSLKQKRLKKRLYLEWRLRQNLNRAAAIHFTSDTERDVSMPVGFLAPTIMEPNGIDLAEFDLLPPAGTFRARYPQLGDRPVVLFMSRIHPKKGLDLLIPAFQQAALENAMLVIAGPGSKEYLRQLHALVQCSGLESRTLFTGMLSGRDRITALVDADLFVLPSYQENFGIVVIESLAAGTPVVISDQINTYQQIAAAAVGAVVSTEVASLSKALTSWLNDTGKRQRASLKAKAFARQHFDWRHISHHWINHYRRVVNEARYRRELLNDK